MIEIPPNKLADEILVSIIEEFINREGTKYREERSKAGCSNKEGPVKNNER